MRYQEQMREMLISLALGYGVGYVLSQILTCLVVSGFTLAAFLSALLIDILLGSIISIIIMANKGLAAAHLYSLLFSLGKSVIYTLISAICGSTLGVVLFCLLMFVLAVPAISIIIYMAISFPLTIVYITVMYFIEKARNGISDNVADWLDRIVPIVSGLLTLFLGILIIQLI